MFVTHESSSSICSSHGLKSQTEVGVLFFLFFNYYLFLPLQIVKRVSLCLVVFHGLKPNLIKSRT